jgi:hypothetical protein
MQVDKNKSAMLFAEWFQKNGIRKNWFAEQIGVDSVSISRWLSGSVRPFRN